MSNCEFGQEYWRIANVILPSKTKPGWRPETEQEIMAREAKAQGEVRAIIEREPNIIIPSERNSK